MVKFLMVFDHAGVVKHLRRDAFGPEAGGGKLVEIKLWSDKTEPKRGQGKKGGT